MTQADTAHHRDLVPPPPETGAEFPVLDTLRAVGAFAVLTTHVAFWSGATTSHGVLGTLLGRLDVGVAIFFVLSGFLLSRAWLLRSSVGRPAPGTRAYLWKRLVRIYPVYLVAALPALWLIESNRSLDLGDRISTVLLLSTTTGPGFPAGLTHMWSLAVEVAFYLVLPIIMLVLVGRRGFQAVRFSLGLVILGVISAWWHVVGAEQLAGQVAGAPATWLPGYLGWFALGIGLAGVQARHATAPGRFTRAVVRLGRQPGSCWVIVAGLLLMSATPLAGPVLLVTPDPAAAGTKHVFYAGIGLLVVLTGVFTTPGSRYARVMSLAPLRRLGWISYGIFCVHLPLLHFVMWATDWPLFQGRTIAIWVLTVAISVVTADIVYRLVERPALRLKRLVRERPAATATPTTGTNST